MIFTLFGTVPGRKSTKTVLCGNRPKLKYGKSTMEIQIKRESTLQIQNKYKYYTKCATYCLPQGVPPWGKQYGVHFIIYSYLFYIFNIFSMLILNIFSMFYFVCLVYFSILFVFPLYFFRTLASDRIDLLSFPSIFIYFGYFFNPKHRADEKTSEQRRLSPWFWNSGSNGARISVPNLLATSFV